MNCLNCGKYIENRAAYIAQDTMHLQELGWGYVFTKMIDVFKTFVCKTGHCEVDDVRT